MNARRLIIISSAVALCIACMAAQSVRADGADSVSITLSTSSGTPGSIIDVDGTITNSGPDTLNLDYDNLSVSGPISVNDEFLTNAPYTLGPGSVTFEFFQLMIATGATPGAYGTDGSNVFSFFGDFNGVSIEDDVAFTVDVTGPVAATPEPETVWLLCAGACILAWFYRRHNRIPRNFSHDGC
jgi:hypothetical protein